MPAIHGKHSIFIIYERLAVVQGEQKIKFLCTGGDAVSGSAAPEQRHEQRRPEGGTEASPGISFTLYWRTAVYRTVRTVV